MLLSAGARLGPYEILALVGAGGMGEVYKARDTRLNRFVALKLLPAAVTELHHRRQRFQAEARAISSLSHPHICALFDVGEHDNLAYLVMEYLEGETLDDRLTRGALPESELIRHAGQIVDALDHAHRQGIIHRDLKPSNVFLTESGVKLLDFGLAKSRTPLAVAAGSTVSVDPMKLTSEGTIVGTLQYIAPEQLEGKDADSRADLFAFGALLYEMATGRKAFEGPSQAGLIAAILTAQPPSIPETRAAAGKEPLPYGLDHVARRCLAKNPDERWQTARDLKFELDWIAEGGSRPQAAAAPSRRRSREAIAWGAAIVATVAALAAVFVDFRQRPADAVRFVVTPPAGATIGAAEIRTRLAVSPDGRHLTFVATTEGQDRLWVQPLGSLTPQVLAGTEGASSPFWSPDSRFIGFFAAGEGQIKKVEASGGPARTICAAQMQGTPVWNRDGTILFTVYRDGIYRVSAEGGVPARVTQVDRSRRGEMNHLWPDVLPDGRHFLYLATGRDANGERVTPSVYAASLDSAATTLVARVNSRMVYVPPGHVLYVHEGTLLAHAFDANRLRLVGEPTRVAEGLDYFWTLGHAAFSVSRTGVLTYLKGASPTELVWFDRDGKAMGSIWSEQRFTSLRLSPDGQRVAVGAIDPRFGTADIWVYDLARGVPTRFTANPADESFPLWSPDLQRIVFATDRFGSGALFAKDFDATAAEVRLLPGPDSQEPEDWSADGASIIYAQHVLDTGRDLWVLPLTGDRKPRPFLRTRFEEWGARISADSAWVAFVSDESGRSEVYVAPMSGRGDKQRISTGGGLAPRWRRDGTELFYVATDGTSMMTVPVTTKPTFTAGLPRRLFTIGTPATIGAGLRQPVYEVSPDGQRFLIDMAAGGSSSAPVIVVLNWASGMTR